MKTKLIIMALFAFNFLLGQENIPSVYVNEAVSTHFVSDEKLTYSDISTNLVIGDFPLENILRIKPKKNTKEEMGYVTIVGESFFQQFKIVYVHDVEIADKKIEINRDEIKKFKHPKITLTSAEMKSYAKRMVITQPELSIKGKRENKMRITVNNIWVIGEYFFFDFSVNNKTNIQYDIDEVRYKIVDKRVKKAVNNQDKEIHPVLYGNGKKTFHKNMRNVVVLKKFTFPNKKQFRIILNEDQISGRTVEINISYMQILKAKSFPTGFLAMAP